MTNKPCKEGITISILQMRKRKLSLVLGDLNTVAWLHPQSQAFCSRKLRGFLPPHPVTRVPSRRIPNCAFCSPPALLTRCPSLTTFPKHSPVSMRKKPPFWATLQPAARTVSSTVARRLDAQPPGPPGSSTEKVRRGSTTRVRWPVTARSAKCETKVRTAGPRAPGVAGEGGQLSCSRLPVRTLAQSRAERARMREYGSSKSSSREALRGWRGRKLGGL